MKQIYAAILCCLFSGAQLRAQIAPERIAIVRDSFGVPHIFAPTDAETAYGLAWAHCEDDFETIQTGFLAAKGLLGSVIGKDGAAVDFVVGFIRAREIAAARYERDISPDYRRVLEGYCAGFNAFARAHPKELRHSKLLPLTPQDMATYAMLQMFVFTGGDAALQSLIQNRLPRAVLPATEGSNAFAFSARKTADGQVYLNINSHQPWEGIVAWYEAHLCSEEGWNIVGGLFPGAPNILHGCNEYLGWAHTVNNPDKLDVYQLEMHPKNKLQYRFDDQWLQLEERRIPLRVRIAGIPLRIRKKAWHSVYGPTLKNKTGWYSIRSSGMFDVRALEQWYRMNKAQNFTHFYKALQMEAIPGFNVVYADRNDTIFYLSNGKLPLREKGYDWKGVLPGNTSKTLWTRFHPLKDLPQILNPPSGYVFNTNNTPFNASAPEDNLDSARFDPAMGYELYDNNRSRRFMERMQGLDKLSYEDFKNIKYDRQLPAQLAYLTRFDSLFSLDTRRHPDIAPLIERLRAWDHRGEADNIAATYFVIASGYLYQLRGLEVYDQTTLSAADCAAALRYTRARLLRYYKTIDVPLGRYQKLKRGKWSFPLAGLPDALAAIYSLPEKDGSARGVAGESYIELVRFTPQGPRIESVNVYGASNRPNSPHYADQAPLFLQQKTKAMPLDKQSVYRAAAEIYRPGEIRKKPAKLK